MADPKEQQGPTGISDLTYDRKAQWVRNKQFQEYMTRSYHGSFAAKSKVAALYDQQFAAVDCISMQLVDHDRSGQDGVVDKKSLFSVMNALQLFLLESTLDLAIVQKHAICTRALNIAICLRRWPNAAGPRIEGSDLDKLLEGLLKTLYLVLPMQKDLTLPYIPLDSHDPSFAYPLSKSCLLWSAMFQQRQDTKTGGSQLIETLRGLMGLYGKDNAKSGSGESQQTMRGTLIHSKLQLELWQLENIYLIRDPCVPKYSRAFSIKGIVQGISMLVNLQFTKKKQSPSGPDNERSIQVRHPPMDAKFKGIAALLIKAHADSLLRQYKIDKNQSQFESLLKLVVDIGLELESPYLLTSTLIYGIKFEHSRIQNDCLSAYYGMFMHLYNVLQTACRDINQLLATPPFFPLKDLTCTDLILVKALKLLLKVHAECRHLQTHTEPLRLFYLVYSSLCSDDYCGAPIPNTRDILQPISNHPPLPPPTSSEVRKKLIFFDNSIEFDHLDPSFSVKKYQQMEFQFQRGLKTCLVAFLSFVALKYFISTENITNILAANPDYHKNLAEFLKHLYHRDQIASWKRKNGSQILYKSIIDTSLIEVMISKTREINPSFFISLEESIPLTDQKFDDALDHVKEFCLRHLSPVFLPRLNESALPGLKKGGFDHLYAMDHGLFLNNHALKNCLRKINLEIDRGLFLAEQNFDSSLKKALLQIKLHLENLLNPGLSPISDKHKQIMILEGYEKSVDILAKLSSFTHASHVPTLIYLSYNTFSNTADLSLSFFKAEQKEICLNFFCVPLSACNYDMGADILDHLLAKFSLILAENSKTLAKDFFENPHSPSLSEKRRWWEVREDLDCRLEMFLIELERLLLGDWLVKLLKSDTRYEELPILMDQSKPPPPSSVQASVSNINHINNGQPIFLGKNSIGPSFVILLDRTLHVLPVESAPSLSKKAVFRIPPHLDCELDYAKIIENQSEIKTGYYIINPDSDLNATQRLFVPFFQQQNQQWDGIVSERPNKDNFRVGLQEHEILVYLGHGSGEKYFSLHELGNIRCKASIFLIGCSSAKLKDNGHFGLRGVGIRYLSLHSPAVVGTLWDVTDKDIDRLGVKLLDLWLNEDQVESLAEPVYRSRGECRLKYLVGASVIVYGLLFRRPE